MTFIERRQAASEAYAKHVREFPACARSEAIGAALAAADAVPPMDEDTWPKHVEVYVEGQGHLVYWPTAASGPLPPPPQERVEVNVDRDDGSTDTYLVRRASGPLPERGPSRCENCGKTMAEHDALARCWPERAPTDESFAIPERVMFDARGYGWRWFKDMGNGEPGFSMVPVTDDNLPMPEPWSWFVPESFGYRYWQRVGGDAAEQLAEALRELAIAFEPKIIPLDVDEDGTYEEATTRWGGNPVYESALAALAAFSAFSAPRDVP